MAFNADGSSQPSYKLLIAILTSCFVTKLLLVVTSNSLAPLMLTNELLVPTELLLQLVA